MKRNSRDATTAVANGALEEGGNNSSKTNGGSKSNGGSKTTGGSVAIAQPPVADLSVILAGLQTMRNGDFSVRLPGSWTGIEGKIPDTFNTTVAANQQMAQELKRVGQVVGKEGRTRERTRFHESKGAWGDMQVSVNAL